MIILSHQIVVRLSHILPHKVLSTVLYLRGVQTYFVSLCLYSSIHSFSRYFLNMCVLAEEETLTLASRILHCLNSLPSSQMCLCKSPSFCPVDMDVSQVCCFPSIPSVSWPSET